MLLEKDERFQMLLLGHCLVQVQICPPHLYFVFVPHSSIMCG